MADSGNEYTGKSVDEAIAEGLNKLGLSRDEVEIEIINRGSRGIFGLGSEPARVRIVPRAISAPSRPAGPPAKPPAQPAARPAEAQPSEVRPSDSRPSQATPTPTPPSPVTPSPTTPSPVTPPPAPAGRESTPAGRTPGLADLDGETDEETIGEAAEGVAAPADPEADEAMATMAVELLDEMVRLMGFDAQVTASWHAPDDPSGDRYLLLDIHGQDVSPLIGRRGETLASIQYLVRLMVNQRLKQWKNIVVDVEHYKERRVAQLTQLALRMAEQVAESGRAVSLEPMPPNERRIVHLALRDHPAVYTQSSGEGDRRKVHIVAKS